ncbi:TIGR04282 family arsenosugar biosynthesis glycosyltransferase [Fibrobacterota bacterium]
MEKNKNSSTIVIFAKVPGTGTAKSRIAATHGSEKAAEIYDQLLAVTAEIVNGLPYHVAFTDNNNCNVLGSIFTDALSFFPQHGNTLGDRLYNAFMHLYNEGYQYICAIGTDCPALTKIDLENSLAILENGSDTVIGPAKDGGYYLVGCNKKGTEIFSAKNWSSPDLLEETMEIINSKSLTTQLLKPLSDIDYMEDYLSWKKSLDK